MVADISYSKAIQLTHPFHIKGKTYLTNEDRGILVLRRLGFKVRKRFLKSFHHLTSPAILGICDEVSGMDHVVVWNPFTSEVMEPSKEHQWITQLWYEQHLEYVLLLRK